MLPCFILRKGDWNELTGHPKDRGRDRPDLRTNSLQPGDDDVDQIQFRAFLLLRLIAQSSAHLCSIAPTIANDRRTRAQESMLSEEATDDRGSIVQSSARLRSIVPLIAIDRTRGPYVNFMRFIIIFK